MEKGIVPLTIPSRDPLGTCLLPVPIVLSSDGLEVLVQEGEGESHNEHLIALESQIFLWPFGLLISLSQQANSVRRIELDYHGDIGLLLYNGDKKDHVWSAGDP